MPILFFSEQTNFELAEELTITTRSWLEKVIVNENKKEGDLNYIFCSNTYLHQLNLKHLNHDTLTDVITFDYCKGDLLSGDIFISIDMVKENAITYQKTFLNELSRTMVHGILHLIGYNDKSKEEILMMREKEDFYLSLHSL